MKTILVTGSCGLVGSEAVEYFTSRGIEVIGIDNDMRGQFFGNGGSTAWRRKELLRNKLYNHFSVDIRDDTRIAIAIRNWKPEAVIHCAGQPSHDLAAERAAENWDINVTATFKLLEACRQSIPESPFMFMSSNKVYGDRSNRWAMKESATRYEYVLPSDMNESLPAINTCRSIYGASKHAADIAVQEYGAYFGMPTVCLRAACLTGSNHSGVALHGFLSYLVKCNLSKSVYEINNYKGKQVRDNLHAFDVVQFMAKFIDRPTCGEVYNIGGGAGTDVSVLEAFKAIEQRTGIPMRYEFVDKPRRGDFMIWVTDYGKAQRDYDWKPEVSLDTILDEITAAETAKI